MRFGKIPNLPWYLRMFVFVAAAAVIYGAFWYFVTRGVRNENATVQGEIATLKPRNAQAMVVAQRLNDFKAMYKAREEEYAELKALLPEQREITMVLQGIQDRVRGNNLTLMRFNPKEDVQEDNYSGKKIEVTVTSSFANLRGFFQQLAQYQRIVSVTNFELKQLELQTPNKTLDAKFELTAYYVASDRLPKQQAPTAGTGGPTQTAAPQPAAPQPAK